MGNCRVYLLPFLAAVLITFSAAHAQVSVSKTLSSLANATAEKDYCRKVRRHFKVNYDGCDPVRVRMLVCEGTMTSFELMGTSQTGHGLMSRKSALKCAPEHYNSRKSRVLRFNCGGKSENHTIYFPRIRSCKSAPVYFEPPTLPPTTPTPCL